MIYWAKKKKRELAMIISELNQKMNGLTLNSGCFKGGEREVLFDPWPWDMIVSFRRSNARGSRYTHLRDLNTYK